MAGRLGPDTYRLAVPANHDSVWRDVGNADFLSEDRYRRDNHLDGLRYVAGANSQLSQHGAGDAGNLPEPEHDNRVRFEIV